MASLRSRVIAQAKRVAKTRSRVIYHAKRGRRAPKLRRVLARQRATLSKLRKALSRSRDPRKRAVIYARTLLGEVESPAGSNRGRRLTGWQKSFGEWLIGQPWCGVFVGVILRHVGVKVTSRIASVAMIEDDARAGRNGFKSWRSARGGRSGDVAVLFGRGVHTEFIAKKTKTGYWTYGGNTSPEGGGGSQSNGGGSFKRFRPFDQVHGVAVPAYPS